MPVSDALGRHARRAKAILDAAKAASRPPGGSKWEEGDPADVSLLAGMMLQLVMNEERLGSVPIPQAIVEPGRMTFLVAGFHLPGHVDADGIPVVCLLPPGTQRMCPPDSLPVAIILPAGREAEIEKTYPKRK